MAESGAEEGWSNPWPGFFIMAMGALGLLIRNVQEAKEKERAEKTLKAEKIYSKWLQDRLNNNQNNNHEVIIAIQHVVVPKGPMED